WKPPAHSPEQNMGRQKCSGIRRSYLRSVISASVLIILIYYVYKIDHPGLIMPSKIIVICASGPSLCAEDISFVYKLGIPIIAVNSSWIIAPECQFIFSADNA
ncbi:hypothetical protein PVT62_25490, partial [Rahnella contaminans]|nr:hypothetical protein [Rahnella contaminans]